MPVAGFGRGFGPSGSGVIWRENPAGIQCPANVNTSAQSPNQNLAAGTGTVGGANTHPFRYYRLYVTNDGGGNGFTALTELALAEVSAGPDTTAGQTITSGGDFGGFPASNAVDDDVFTAWASATLPGWIQVDYGATAGNWKVINELRIAARGGVAANQAPYAFVFQGSDDGSAWTDLLSQSSETFAPLEVRSYLATASGAASNDISGTAALTFAPSGTVTGTGTLAGSATLSLTESGTLTGNGTLAGSSSLTLSESGTVSGIGPVSGSSSVSFSPSGAVSGKAALTGSSALAFAPSGTILGRGTLAGGSTVTFAQSAGLTGIGSVSGSTTVSLDGSGSVTGTAALLGSTSLTFGLSGTVGTASSNDIEGTAGVSFVAAATLLGVGAAQAASDLSLTASATMTGTGQLTGAASFTLTPSGEMVAVNDPFTTTPHPPRAILTIAGEPGNSNVNTAARPSIVRVTRAANAADSVLTSAPRPARVSWRT